MFKHCKHVLKRKKKNKVWLKKTTVNKLNLKEKVIMINRKKVKKKSEFQYNIMLKEKIMKKIKK
jgi:hypothetical protein